MNSKPDFKKDSNSSSQLTPAIPLAVVGIGCLFPKAADKSTYWANIKNKMDAITEVPETHWRVSDYYDPDPRCADHTYGKRGGFLDPVDFNPLEFNIQPNIIEAIDTSQLLGLIAAREALRDAGYDPDGDFARERVSVLLGVTGALEMVIPLGARLGHPIWKKALLDSGVPAEVADEVVERISASYVPWQENSFPGLLGNVVAGRISKQFNLGGSNSVVDAACGSSLSAVHIAAMELACGHADMVVTGGIDTFNDIFMFTCFSKTPALSPTNQIRPFDEASDGTMIGEGLGLVTLKRLEDAERDGDHIYAVIKSVGSGSDGKGGAIYEPSVNGQKRTLLNAQKLANVEPRDITLIEAHGTGTMVGDATEIKALREVFGDSDGAPWCALGSVKSQIGHAKAAAGAAGLIKTVLALHNKILPPTINVTKPQDIITAGNSPFYVNTEVRPWVTEPNKPRRAGVSAFGFGGSNYHCILEEYQHAKRSCDWDGCPQILAWSAATLADLKHQLGQSQIDLQENVGVEPNTAPSTEQVRQLAARNRTAFDPSAKHRLVCCIDDSINALTTLSQANTLLESGKDQASTPTGIYYSAVEPIGADTNKIAVLFPGQGAQYPFMLRDLACHAPEMLEELERADATLELEQGQKLSDLIYPHSVYTNDDKDAAAQKLQATQHAQPAIGSVSFGAWRYLQRYGIKAGAFGGHSYGELTALCAAHCYTPAELYQLSGLRGTLMRGDGSDKGSMLAVSAPLADIEALLKSEGLDLIIANKNTPQQGVLSGTRAEIERAATACKNAGMRCIPLDVAAAFHSKLVAAASEPFHAGLKSIAVQAPDAKAYANKTGSTYPSEPDAIRTLLAQQIASPVEFVHQIEQMHADGITTFIEVGPGARLSGMVKKILPSSAQAHIVTLDSSNGKRAGMLDVARVLAQLAALGLPLKLQRWDEDYAQTYLNRPAVEDKKPRMSIKICGANSTKEREPIPPSTRTLVDSGEIHCAPCPPKSGQQASQIQAQPQQSLTTPGDNQFQSQNSSTLLAASSAAGTWTGVISQGSQGGSTAPSLQMLHSQMSVLQQMQEDTARLHEQFLAGQTEALHAMRTLMGQADAPTESLSNPPAPAIVPQVSQQVASRAPQSSVTRTQTTANPGANAQAHAQSPSSQHQSAQPAIDIAAELLRIVAEKTGYPTEMLELDMSLDADLGIDSIKRVEILAAVQEQLPELPGVEPQQLSSLQTLRQIVETLSSAAAELSSTPLATPASNATTTHFAAANIDVAAELLRIVAEKTGYPTEMLELDMSLDADLGIDSIKRVEILAAVQEQLPELPGVEPQQLSSLQTLRQIVETLSSAAAELSSAPQAVSATGAAPSIDVATELLRIVAEKTGYPTEMLELDMSLDADLGIDSIKRVEILAAVQEQLPELPGVEPQQLSSLQTLRQIVETLSSAAAESGSATTTNIADIDVAAELLRIVAEKTGYPTEMLELDMSLDADLGIDSIKRVEILAAVQEQLPELPGVEPQQLSSLQTLRQIAETLEAQAPNEVTTPSTVACAQCTQAAPSTARSVPATGGTGIQRQIVCLSTIKQERTPLNIQDPIMVVDDTSPLTENLVNALLQAGYAAKSISPNCTEIPQRLGGLVIPAPGMGTDSDFIRDAFTLLQRCAPALHAAAANADTVFITLSRLDGSFGFTPDSILQDPISGGLAGLSKTAWHEWPAITCRAVDLDPLMPTEEQVRHIVYEIGHSGPPEVGIASCGVCTLELRDEALPAQIPELNLSSTDVVIISGGGRGVTAAVALQLAQTTSPTLLILGRSAVPKTEKPWLAHATTAAQVKQAVLTNTKAKLSPKELNARCERILNQRELRCTIEQLEQAGSRVIYRALDIRDEDAVSAAIDEARQRGTVRGIIHGAGVLADKAIADKTTEQFDLVYSTKIGGLQALLQATADDDLVFIALFSSSTGRFGRTGQIDYAAANEVMNKTAQALARQRQQCRVVSLNWGPWDGGMVTAGLKKLFASEGISVIDLDAGSRYLLQELASPSNQVELVILGGDTPASKKKNLTTTPPTQSAPLGQLSEKVLQIPVSCAHIPCLRDHVIAARAVVPMALSAEWLALGAMHSFPGLTFYGFDQLRICRGIILEQTATCQVELRCGQMQPATAESGTYVVPMQVCDADSGMIYSSAEVILADARPATAPSPFVLNVSSELQEDKKSIYADTRLFHGPALQGLEQVLGLSAEGISAMAHNTATPASWMQTPLRHNWLSAPMLLDSSFQLMILWCFARQQCVSLPSYIRHYRQYVDAMPAEELTQINCLIRNSSASMVQADIDFVTPDSGLLLARIEGYECTMTDNLGGAFSCNTLD